MSDPTPTVIAGDTDLIGRGVGQRKVSIGTLTLGDDYAAGGFPIGVSDVGFRERIDALIVLGPGQNFSPVYDGVNGKILMYDTTDGTEVADGLAGLLGLIVQFVAFGR
jgi:hypothetical protein